MCYYPNRINPDRTLGDISLGSLGSASFHSPPRPEQRLTSVTSLSTAASSATLPTPSPSQPLSGLYSQTKMDVTTTPTVLRHFGDEPDRDLFDARDEPATPVAARSKGGQTCTGAAKGGINLTLREQERYGRCSSGSVCNSM